MSPSYECQCHHPGPKHHVSAPGEQFCRGCWHCPSSVSGGAGWGTRSHCTADKGESDWRSQAVSSAPGVRGCLEGGRLQVVQAQFCCPDGHALAQGRGEVHHSPLSPAAPLGCLDSPPPLCMAALNWGERGTWRTASASREQKRF